MPVNVHIPIRVRLDAESLEGRDEDLADALQAAIRRALDHSERVVLKPRNHYLGVQMRDAQFSWSGEGLDFATAEQRRRIQSLVATAIDEAARASRVGARARARVNASPPLGDSRGERFDRGRFDGLGNYLLPSYDKGGDTTAVPIASQGDKPAEPRVIWELAELEPGYLGGMSSEFRHDILTLELERVGASYQRGTRFYGLMYRQGGEYPLVLEFMAPQGDTFYYEIAEFGSEEAVPAEAGDLAKKEQPVSLAESIVEVAWAPAATIHALREREIRSYLESLPLPPDWEPEEFSKSKDAYLAADSAATKAQFTSDGLVIGAGGRIHFISMSPDERRFTGVGIVAPFAYSHVIDPDAKTDKDGAARSANARKKSDTKGDKASTSKGGYLDMGEAGINTGEFAFPRPDNAWNVSLVCESFTGEPSVDELPQAIAAELWEMINDIAARLGIDACGYAGHFAITAAWVLGQMARNTAEFATQDSVGMLQPPKRGKVSGATDFVPAESAAVQLLRLLGDLVPRITQLARRIDSVYREHSKLIQGVRHGNHLGWMLDFGYEFNEAMKESVAQHFRSSTRTVFLQLLHSSKLNLDARTKAGEKYIDFFEHVVRRALVPENELKMLRDQLAKETEGIGTKIVGGVIGTWREARNGIFDLVNGGDPFGSLLGSAATGVIVDGPDGKKRVKDSAGNVWTLAKLDQTLALHHDTAVGIDPLMQQLVSDPNLRKRFLNSIFGIRMELKQLLAEMTAANVSVTERVSNDEHYAFTLASIDSDYGDDNPPTIQGTGYVLQGVHLLAHQTMHQSFRNDVYYRLGVDHAMTREDMRRSADEFLKFAIPLVLSVFCGPLGVLAGAAVAISDRMDAGDKMEAYKALINPELVFNYAELEAELFAADLGVALSFIPIPGMAKTAGVIGGRAAKTLVTTGARAAGGLVVRSVHRVLTKAMVKAIRAGLVKEFVKQLVIGEIMSRAISHFIIDPVVEQMQREHLTYQQLIALADEVEPA
jgi:hypothetical protein